jgi:hypothetical protein
MDHRFWLRVIFAYLTFQSLQIGIWALFAPQSFYDNFPGPRSWVSVDGPYNEHLLRDVGALNIALGVVLLIAAIRLTWGLVLAASLATLAWGVPHLVYHVFNTDGLSSGDLAASLGGLAIFAALPIVALVLGRRLEQPDADSDADADVALAAR